MVVCSHFVSQAAPFAGHGRVLVSFVELDVLDRMAEAKLLHPHAPNYFPRMVDYWQGIDQLLGIGLVRIVRFLHSFIA